MVAQCTQQRATTTIFGQTQKSFPVRMPSLRNVQRSSQCLYRCTGTSETDTHAIHNLDNSIKVNMEKVFW